MQKMSLKIFQVTIKAKIVTWKIFKDRDSFIFWELRFRFFISLKLRGEKYRLVILLEE